VPLSPSPSLLVRPRCSVLQGLWEMRGRKSTTLQKFPLDPGSYRGDIMGSKMEAFRFHH
jgi:hypothetical protein